MTPYTTISIRISMTWGWAMTWKACSWKVIGMPTMEARAVFSVLPFTSRPSICFSRSGRSLAMRSITFSSSALSDVMAALSRTEARAHSALR